MPAARPKGDRMTAALIGLLGNADPKLASDVHRRIVDRRRMANVLRRFNRGLLGDEADLRSIAKCGNTLGSTVMLRRGRDGSVRPSGIATCKSVWGCLGCAARRRALKSAMVKYYVTAHQAAGKGVSFGSFTLAHYPTDNLADLLEGLRKAFTDMRHLKVYRDAEAEHGIIGWIAALEITHGANGWHPHPHVLFFHDRDLEVEYGDNAGLRAALHEAFARQIDRHLGRAVHQIHGVDLVPVRTESRGGDEALARYLGKIQLEMTRQDLKTARFGTSRSPWLIGLDAAETGDARDIALWCEYLRATKGRNVVTTGGHLADHYGEPTDEQLHDLIGDPDLLDDFADDTDEGQDVASMSADVWTDLINHRNEPTASVVADALTVLETDGPDAMADLISDRLAIPVEVTTNPETELPHLRYRNRSDRRDRFPPQLLTEMTLQRFGSSTCTANPEWFPYWGPATGVGQGSVFSGAVMAALRQPRHGRRNRNARLPPEPPRK